VCLVSAGLDRSRGLLDGLLALGEDELDVGGVCHVGGDAAVCAVCATACLGGALCTDVADNEAVEVELLGDSVGLGVLQEAEHHFTALLGPASLSGKVKVLHLCLASHTAGETAEWDDLTLGNDVAEILLGTNKGHALDGSTHLTHVLKVGAHIDSTGTH